METNKELIIFSFSLAVSVMARGHQKAQSQAKNLAKQAAIKSKQGHNANAQKKAAAKALTYQCPVCRVSYEHCFLEKGIQYML